MIITQGYGLKNSIILRGFGEAFVLLVLKKFVRRASKIMRQITLESPLD